MNGHSMNQLNWSLIKSFLAVAEHGSFSAAARSTGQSQPTVGRHIDQLARALGSDLFTRTKNGHEPTETGLQMLTYARKMNTAAAGLSMVAAGPSEALSGTVRITASLVVSQYLLPKIIAKIRRSEPKIEIELTPSDTTENLLFREADIAVRMYRPQQLDVITKQIGVQQLGLFATSDYIAANGHPKTLGDISRFDIIGYDRSDLMIGAMRQMGVAVDRNFFPTRCDNQTVYIELMRAGCGIGAVALTIAAQDPTLIRVLPDLELPELPIWLTAHTALHSSARIRCVYDILAAELTVATRG